MQSQIDCLTQVNVLDPRHLQKILDIIPTAIIVIDDSGVVQEVNPAANHILGSTLIGHAWVDIIEQYFCPKSDDGHDVSLINGKRVNISTCSLHPEPGQLVIMTDVTETRKLQQEMSQQQRLQAMGRMMAQLAHQIRTPLATSLLYTSHLNNQNINNDKRHSFSLKVQKCLQNIEQQIRDMLLFAKNGETLLTPIKLSDLIRDVKMMVEPLCHKASAVLTIQDESNGLITMANKEALMGALHNLINNALEIENESIEVSLSCETDGTHYKFSIKDNGAGISNDDIQSIFQPFITTKSKGTGLGLAVVKAVAQAHGGEVTVQSVVNQGATFIIKLPIIAPHALNQEEQS